MNVRDVGIVLGGLAALAAHGCSRASSKPAAETGVPVHGTLVEGYTGRPLNAGEVVLTGQRKGSRVIAAATRLDAGGGFRFDRVAPDPTLSMPNFLSLGWKPAQGDIVHATETAGGSGYVYADLAKAAGKPLDLGSRHVWVESAALEMFAPFCRTGQPVAAAPAGTPVLVFVKDPGKDYALAPKLHKDVASAWPAGVRGVVCIETAEANVGRYGGQFQKEAAVAIKVTWKVTALRLPDGQIFRTTLQAQPPAEIQVDLYTGRPIGATAAAWERRGDPMPKLRAWLQGLAKALS